MLTNEEVIDLGAPATGAPPATPADEPPTAIDTGAERAFEGATAPHLYSFDVLPGAEVDEAYMADEQGIRAALHAEGIPTATASLGHMLVQQAVRNGLPDDQMLEAARGKGIEVLEQRHGANAPQIIADAKAVFDRLDKRDPRLGDLLVNSGVASNPNFIEALARLHGVRGRK